MYMPTQDIMHMLLIQLKSKFSNFPKIKLFLYCHNIYDIFEKSKFFRNNLLYDTKQFQNFSLNVIVYWFNYTVA